MAIIEARGLARTFKSRKRTVEAVRGVDLTVRDGEIVGFLGPNGAGKTTTLRMLTTLLRPTAGTATVAGADLLANPLDVRKKIGYVPQAIGETMGGTDPSCLVIEELLDQAALYRIGAGRGAAAGGAAGRAARADRARAAAGQDAVRRAAAAAGDRARAGAPAAAGLPGRADHRPGPAEPQQPVGAHRQPAVRSGHHGLPHHALPGGSGRPVRPGVHHRPRGDRGRGHARSSSSGASPATW